MNRKDWIGLFVAATLVVGLLIGVSGAIFCLEEKATSDGGQIITGETISRDCNSMDIWLAKTNAEGNEEWNKTFEISGCEYSSSVEQTFDGGYIIVGSVRRDIAGAGYILLIKIDADGNKEWDKALGIPWSYGESVKQTADGGYVIVGEKLRSDYRGQRRCSSLLIKTDVNGTKEWSESLGLWSHCREHTWSIEQTADKGYIIEAINSSGYTWTTEIDNNGTKQVKTILNGSSKEWNKTFRGDTWAYYCSIKQTSDGGYISKGYLNYIEERQLYRVDLIVKIDVNGSEEWKTVSAPIRAPQTRGNSQGHEGYVLAPTPTPAQMPTPTPETSGFEAIFAIAGFSAIAYLLLKRR